jgi:hypothetical protein
MRNLRLKNLRELAWHMCYMATLLMLLAAASEQRAEAYCPFGSPDCGAMLSPCPWSCSIFNLYYDTFDPSCAPTNNCRMGWCVVNAIIDFYSYTCLPCAVESYGVCITVVDA